MTEKPLSELYPPFRAAAVQAASVWLPSLETALQWVESCPA